MSRVKIGGIFFVVIWDQVLSLGGVAEQNRQNPRRVWIKSARMTCLALTGHSANHGDYVKGSELLGLVDQQYSVHSTPSAAFLS